MKTTAGTKHDHPPVVAIVIDWIMVVPTLYLLPWLWARGARHRREGLIGLLTVLAGWTIIGWVAALAWAVRRSTEANSRT